MRPTWLDPRSAWLVASGAALGAAGRAAVADLTGRLSSPTPFQAQLAAVMIVNLLGALALGGIAAVRNDERRLRWGVGFCGAFTTMSGLASLADDSPILADIAPGLGALITIVAATVAGVIAAALGRRWATPKFEGTETEPTATTNRLDRPRPLRRRRKTP
ncbi:MAG: CrcB family protein [Actinobacteria bacterium]|nr:CrcB family protein [Actinomycetota bacterium]MCB9389717.1 CrcB family protein [Acidimicrobiia bacterium]